MLFIVAILVAVGALFVWRKSREGVRAGNQQAGPIANLSAIVSAAFFMIALVLCFAMIPAGHVGVVDFFGTVSDRTLPPGINPVNPLARVIRYDIRTQEHKETMQVLSREGLSIGLEISVLYRLNPDSAARMYQTISGGDYETIILIPQFR